MKFPLVTLKATAQSSSEPRVSIAHAGLVKAIERRIRRREGNEPITVALDGFTHQLCSEVAMRYSAAGWAVEFFDGLEGGQRMTLR